jgi:pimeloyl-ACP methyl ester carboxylesterase
MSPDSGAIRGAPKAHDRGWLGREPQITPDQWRARGAEIVVPDGRIFYVDLAPEMEDKSPNVATPILVLHGFPSSSWDFADAANRLRERRRVVLFDFLGFGLSDKPSDAGYSLFEQAEIAIAVARHTKLSRVHVWAHDMGTSVATELLARRERELLPFEIASVTLMNGSIHVDMASLTLGQRVLRSPAGGAFARVAGKRVFGTQMKRIFGQPVADETIDAMWAFVARADGPLRFPMIIRYIEERTRFRRRWIGAVERSELPIHVAWGAKDPVARLAIGQRLAQQAPLAELTTWDNLGHYPQVEDPGLVARDVERFIARIDDTTRGR